MCKKYCCTACGAVRCRNSEYRRTDYWYLYSMVRLTIWRPAVKIRHGQNHPSCANMCSIHEKVSGTKNELFRQLWEKGEGDLDERSEWRECSFGTMRNTPRFRKTSFRTTTLFLSYEALSLVWKRVFMLMGWDEHDLNRREFWFQSCSVALVTGARM